VFNRVTACQDAQRWEHFHPTKERWGISTEAVKAAGITLQPVANPAFQKRVSLNRNRERTDNVLGTTSVREVAITSFCGDPSSGTSTTSYPSSPLTKAKV